MDRMRNVLAATDFPAALASLIYLRWADFIEAEQEAAAAFEGVDFSPVLPRELHWRCWHQLPDDDLHAFLTQRLAPALDELGTCQREPLAVHLHRIGQVLFPAMDQVSFAYSLNGVMDEIDRDGATDSNVQESLSKPGIAALVRWLEDQPFETSTDRRHLLDTYDTILDKGTDRLIGEYRTPNAIARLIAALARPADGERVYDPAFGAANLLTNICDALADRITKESPSTYTIPRITAIGVEINTTAYVIGLTRLALAGVDDPHLELGNSLERYPASNIDKEGFDLVLADPPFGMRVNREGLDHFPIRSRDASSLFIQHALANLRSEGRVIIVVPHGLLSNRSETQVRRWLLERNRVQAIIDLPGNAFAPLTTIRSCLMILGRDGPTNQVRMVDGQFFFEASKGKQPAEIGHDAIKALVKAVYVPDPGKHAWDIDIDALRSAEWDLTPHRRERSELTRVLEELKSETKTSRLDEVSTIMAGRNIPSVDLREIPQSNNPIPYIRIKDVQHGKASRGSSWLSVAAVSTVKPEWKLLAGDILLSKSGTIGKAGIVQNGALGAIAANGHYVIRVDNEQIDPHFLLAYLDSDACRGWLNERASGAVIRHLSIKIIGALPVPIPPLQIQHRVVTQHREHKVDAFLYLTKLLSQADSDPVAETIHHWIGRALSSVNLIKGHENDIQQDLDSFEKLASEPAPIRRCDVCGEPYWLGTVDEEPTYSDPPHNYREGFREVCLACWLGVNDEFRSSPKFEGGGSLVQWSIAVNDSLKGLGGLSSVPRGTSLLNLLQTATHGLHEAESRILGHLPDEDKARRLTLGLVRNLSSVVNRILSQVELEFQVGISHLRSGESQKLPLRIVNRGDLPLRDLRIRTLPHWGEADIPFLKEQATESIVLTGTAPGESDKLLIGLNWSATNLAGQKTQGRRELAISVVTVEPTLLTEANELGGSPYVCGDPVRPDRNDVFFGREELIDQIRRQVLKSGNVVLLEGNRRAGKTSILRHLEGPNVIPGWLGVYCSLQGAEGSQDGVGVPTAEVFREIAKSLARAVHGTGLETPLPDGAMLSPGSKPLGIAKACRSGIGQEAAFTDFREYADVLLGILEENGLGALLMLDEFDKLQEGIDNGITSPQVPENIRFLVQTHPRLSAILTGSRRLKRLREEYWSALFGLGTRLGVSSLPREAARRLVTEPVSGRISYADEAVELAIALTASQPYLLQCLCNRVFDHVARGQSRSVTLDIVESSGKDLVRDNEHFASLWTYAASHRRRFLLALCNRETQNRDPLRLGELIELLVSHGIEVTDETLIADLEFLRELELIDFVSQGGEGRYRLSIPLMGQWIEVQQDFDALQTQARYETEDEHA